MWPDFNFRELRLSLDARNQLAGIYDPIRTENRVPRGRVALLELLTNNAYDVSRGTYIPLTEDLYIEKKLPAFSRPLTEPVVPFHEFFTNGLTIPEGYGTPDFDPDAAPEAILRVTNVGSLVITIEFDGETVEDFERGLAWTRKDGAGTLPLSRVDRELCRFQDYRGFTAVFAGRRSIHFHFVFSTEHLENAPATRSHTERLERMVHDAALLKSAHGEAWNRVNEIVVRVLQPSLEADDKLSRVTQWRRSPWGIRILEKDSVLGPCKGTAVPQIVISENIRTRAARGSKDYLIPPTFSFAHPVRHSTRRTTNRDVPTSASAAMIEEVRELCRAEWGGDYPKLADMKLDKGEWTFRFWNHAGDGTPSTIVSGDHRRLLILGHGHGLQTSFFLPEGLTANQLGELFAIQFGLIAPTGPVVETGRKARADESVTNPFATGDFAVALSRRIERDFRGTYSDQAVSDIQEACRTKLKAAVSGSRLWNFPILILGGEGLGKTTAHLGLLADEAFDDLVSQAPDETRKRFAGFAFRSYEQAEKKVGEFRAQGYSVAVVKTFWVHYEEACDLLGEKVIARFDFDEMKPGAVLEEIRTQQPAVFDRLEEVRRSLWGEQARFSGGFTLLLMTHKAAALWHTGVLNRAWHHPGFDPNGSDEEHKALANKLVLARVLFDDPEPDGLVYVLEGSIHDFIKGQKAAHPNYRNLPRRERLGIFGSLYEELPRKLWDNFEYFEELMRLTLDTLDAVEVNYPAIPFGNDNSPSGIYRQKHGKQYYVGAKEWISGSLAHLTFVTTEALVAEVIERAIQKSGSRVLRVDLRDVPGVYPIKVPTFIDPRAGADRAEEERVSAMAREILQSSENAVVISDGTRGVDGVLSFQSAKGVNGLEEKDIYVIVTNLNPEKYAELNVIGQWLGKDNVIALHYQDQIDQAVGRNRGFRQSSNETKTVLVTSLRLWKNVLDKLGNGAGRTRLYLEVQKPWGPPP